MSSAVSIEHSFSENDILLRAEKIHAANLRVAKHLQRDFQPRQLSELTAEEIDCYLRKRLRDRVRIKAAAGFIERHELKPATVHQELRLLRRMLNIAVKKKLLRTNSCAGVEFPVALKGSFRPHYVTWSEQARIEAQAAAHLRNIGRIIAETGFVFIRS